MKKIIYWIVFFVATLNLKAQAPIGEYQAYVKGYGIGYHNQHASCGGYVELSLFFQDNSQLQLFRAMQSENARVDMNSDIYIFPASKRLRSFKFYARRGYKPKIGSCKNSSAEHNKNLGWPYNSIVYDSKEKNYDSAPDGFNSDFITVHVNPILKVVQDNENTLPLDKNLRTIYSNTGFHHNEYNWQYRIGDTAGEIDNPQGGWIDMPQCNGQDRITLKGEDFLPGDMKAYHGKIIGFRQVANNYAAVSNRVLYVLRLSSPITTITSTVNTSCYDSNDGKVTFAFDRELYDDEMISFALTNNGDDTNTNDVNITKSDIFNNSHTISGLWAGKYRVKIVGKYGATTTYSNTLNDTISFPIYKNKPVVFETNREMVWCFGGNDGWIDLSATGGEKDGVYQYQLNGGDWVDFTNKNTTRLDFLSEGTYAIKVRDANGCVAKEIVDTGNGEPSLGNEIIKMEVITAPTISLKLEYPLNQQPTFYGGTNGKLVAKIDGGTPLANGGYNYQWRDENGVVLNSQTQTQLVSGSFFITLNGVGAGKYFLTITDKNFEIARAKEGCTIVANEVSLSQPDPLEVTIDIHNPISCNAANVYGNEEDINPQDGQRDESQDGALKVTVLGGVPFRGFENDGKPYKYFWKKQKANGDWENYANNQEILTNLSDGNYAINIEDRNGITMGVYVNNLLTQATDFLFYFGEPEKLTVTFDKIDLQCSGDIGGKATAKVKGGVGPYTYQWSNGATTASIGNLSGMPYYVVVYDSKGCRVEGIIEIEAPVQIEVKELIAPLICFNDTGGAIELELHGGTPPYTYNWEHGATTNRIENLEAGTYKVEIRDANGCGLSRAYTLENPAQIPFSLGEDVTLCKSQTWPLDIAFDDSGATYKWTSDNGYESTSSQVVLRDAGIYTAEVTTSDGCVVEDQIEIKRLDITIDSEFLISTQAYVGQEVMLVNVSKPKGDQTEWLLPEDLRFTEVEDDYIKLRFDEVGEYEIGLKQYQGACFATFYKKIIVEESAGFPIEKPITEALVKEFTVAPVPNNGEFTVHIELAKESPISLRLINHISPNLLYRGDFSNSKKYEVPVKVNVASGVYILILETGNQTISKKIIIL